VDVLGFSMGGHVAQRLTLDEPALVRRLVIAGSGPGHVDGTPPGDPKVWQVALKPVNDDADFLFLFFKPSAESQQAGQSYRDRTRRWPDAHAVPVTQNSWKAQLQAAGEISTPQTTLLRLIPTIQHPTLLANGDNDIMVPSAHSYEMFKVMPRAKLMLYPDSGHGFLFQHAKEFGADVLQFLR
jgi:pimeloyl-ACP methyl ester carboxylesterase